MSRKRYNYAKGFLMAVTSKELQKALTEFYSTLKISGALLGSSLTNSMKVALLDGNGAPLSSTRDVTTNKYVHNVTSIDIGKPIVNRSLHRHTGVTALTTVATTALGTDYILTVDSTTGFSIGDYVHIENGEAENTHPKINGLTATTITLDRRIDLAHPIGTSVIQAILDVSSVAGTMASPAEYYIQPPANEIWHLHRILPVMTHGTNGDLGLFGNLVKLPNGMLLRVRQDDRYSTFTNWKTNGEIKQVMFDVEFDSRSGGGGTYGTSGRGTFTAAGTTVILDGRKNDRLELYVQDDITALITFFMNAQGYAVRV